MVISRVGRAGAEDDLLDGIVGRVIVRLNDLIEQERAIAECGEVLSAHHVDEAVRVAQVVHAVDDLGEQGGVALFLRIKRGGEDVPPALAVLAVALVLMDGQAHGDMVQGRELEFRRHSGIDMPGILRVHHRAARAHHRKQRTQRGQHAQRPLAKHQPDQAGDGRNDGGKADLRAGKPGKRKQQRPARHIQLAARMHARQAHGAVDDDRREGEGEAVGVDLRGAVEHGQAGGGEQQKPRLRLRPADAPQDARAAQKPQRKQQACSQHRLHEAVIPAQRAEGAEYAGQQVHDAQVERVARKVLERALHVAIGAMIHQQLRGGKALLAVRLGHKAQNLPHRDLHKEVKQRKAQQHALFVFRKESLMPVRRAQKEPKPRAAQRGQQHERRTAARIERPRGKQHVARGEQVAGNHQPHANQEKDIAHGRFARYRAKRCMARCHGRPSFASSVRAKKPDASSRTSGT